MKSLSRISIIAIVLIGIVTLIRLWFCTQIELVGDESYYWLWSKHIDWSYFSKGPGIAWVIWLGTHVAGDTVLGIRWPSVFLAAGTAGCLFALAKALFDERVALVTLATALIVPLFVIGSLLMTIDPLSVFFWALAALLFWKVKDSDSLWQWAGIGFCIGVGMLCKYTNIAQLICFILFCAWQKEYQKRVFSPQMATMVFTALACLTPVLIWNAQHHWITFHHLEHRGALDEKFHFSPLDAVSFLASQFLVFNPLLMIGLVIVLGRLPRPLTARWRYLLSLFWPLLIFYILLSFQKAGQPNWAVPSYVAGTVLLAAGWDDLMKRSRWARGVGWVVFGLSAGVFIFLHLTPFIDLPSKGPLGRIRFLNRIWGWDQIANEVAKIQKEDNATFLIGNKYATSSMLCFYHSDRPTVYIPTHEGIENQFSFWPSYGDDREKFMGQNALYVSDEPGIEPVLKQEFENVRLIEKFRPDLRGREGDDYYIFDCHNYHGIGQSTVLKP
jgi:4-amino-4-deoxy-L-arabinose transferase-like glycosyltransferase